MNFKNFFISVLFVLFFTSVYSQDKQSLKPSYIGKVTSMVHVPSIASRWALTPAKTDVEIIQDGRASGNIVVPGKDPQKEDDFFVKNPNPMEQKIAGKAANLVFDAYSSGSQPTDPSLAVGPNHVFVVFNTGFIIYDKKGNALTSELAPNPTIFPDGGCCDLTVSYDAAADRWVVTFLGSGAQIAVSDGPDPVNDGWYTYTIASISDYQKLSIWSDGYYMTDNTSSSDKVWALEREQMLLGNASAQVLGFDLPGIVTSGFYSPQAFNVSNANMPAAGNAPIVYLQDDAWSGVARDHIKLWFVDVDWVTTSNSTISAAQEINTTPFISVFDSGSFSNLAQPGGGSDLDALQATIMNQAQFRKFPSYNSALLNFVVDTDASAGELAGVRWIELRQAGDGQPWSLYQEGTYTAADGKHAWDASLIMDALGNIGMGYTSMSGPTTSSTTYVSSYYTGRYANDPAGTMTIAEELIAAGTADIPGSRYGDYSKIDIDPSDDKTFWFIIEYVNGGRKGVVGSFKIAPDYTNDIGVVNIDAPVSGSVLSNAEPVTISIFNYGTSDASNFDVSYQIDGGTVITETYTGTVASASTVQYTFTTTADFSTEGHTYSVTASTHLTSDEDTSNDSITQEITHVAHNDVGITAIVAPVSGSYMGTETITASVTNFGGLEQSNFDVSYVLNGGAPVTEQFTGPIAPGETIDYSFTAQGDFSALQSHNLTVSTSLATDSDNSNDSMSVVIENSACNEQTNNTAQAIGPDGGTITNSIINFADDNVITEVRVTININHTWDSDLDIFLIAPNGTQVELTSDNGSGGDDYIDTIFDDDATTSIVDGSAPFTGSFQPEGSLADFIGLSSQGDWTLQITDDAGGDGGTLNYWSLELCVQSGLSVYDNAIDASDLIVKDLGDNHFDISLATEVYEDNLTLEVFSILGQKLVHHVIEKKDGSYTYPLDMSYCASGVYIVRLGNKNIGKVKRIIVE
jgi:subtilisin-like proprotein convertase family protein